MDKNLQHENIENADFSDVLGEKYLAYALSTIMSRSLPDVRDGLKPVHRRLLYAMQQLKLHPAEGFKKCARVVGDVIGKYHPHGDSAVYDTLVRLAQNFSLRYPLIEGQGNFGSVDGDNAAAMRYTESRLSYIALELMEELDKETVDFRPTYDNTETEPALLPTKFPNLLANGSEGIAVGMATSIPPHNMEELCKAALLLIDNRNASIYELLEHIDGPDFPTGGVIYDSKKNLLSIYESGRGSIKIRCKWERQNLAHGLYQIIISEIPYQVPKSKLIEQIATLLKDKKLPLLGNIRDDSAEEIRIIIEPKNRNIDENILMESLFKLTDLESRANFNLNVISSQNHPKIMNLKEILEEFINHRFQIVTNRSLYEKRKAENRLEILAGLKIAFLNLDEIISIIREEDEPKPILIKKFNLTDNQAEAILNTKLRSLRKLEEESILREHKKLEAKKAELIEILENDKKCWKIIKDEIKEIIKKFGKNTELGKRKTEFAEAENKIEDFKVEAFIEKEPLTIIFSDKGWIRAVKGFISEESGLKFKEGDKLKLLLKAHTTDYLLIPTKKGKFYTIFCDNLAKGKGFGDPLRVLIDIDPSDEVLGINKYNPKGKLLLASKYAKGFIVTEEDVFAQTKLGKQVMTLKSIDDECIKSVEVKENMDKVICASTERKLLVFDIDQVPVLKKGQGVKLIKLKDGYLSDIQPFISDEGFKWSNKKEIRTQKNFEKWYGHRATRGNTPPFGFLKSNKFWVEENV